MTSETPVFFETGKVFRDRLMAAGLRLGLGARALAELAGAVCEDMLLDDYRDTVDAREQRDQAVRGEFDGRNRDEVIRKHGISQATFYRILLRGRKTSAPGDRE